MTVAVTGATGHLGGRVVRNLLESGRSDTIVALVRNTAKAQELAGLGIDVRYADYDDPASLPKALAGVDKLLLIPSPLTDNAVRMVQNAHVIRAAQEAGVKHILYTGYAFAEQSPLPLAHLHLATEYAIRAANLTYTFLRNSFYLHLFLSAPVLQHAINTGELVTNAGNGKVNAATREDLAAAAAAALLGQGHENQCYNLVVPEPWTFDDLAAVLTQISGKKVTHRTGSLEEAKGYLMGAGLPEQAAAAQTGLYAMIAAGETSRSGDDLVRLIGRPTALKEAVERVLQS